MTPSHLETVVAVAICGGVAMVLATSILTAASGADHRPLHVNCPPGSHGKLWSADHGAMIAGPRARASVTGGASPPPLSQRALAPLRPATTGSDIR